MIREVLPPYDFGLRQDAVTDAGDVICIVGDDADRATEPLNRKPSNAELASVPFVSIEEGVSIPLTERALAIRGLARVYVQYAGAVGLNEAKELPGHHTELKKRYKDVDGLAEATMEKAKRELRDEDLYVERLMKTDELIAAGFDPADIEDDKQRITIGLRHNIGVGVGAKKRDATINGLYVPKP